MEYQNTEKEQQEVGSMTLLTILILIMLAILSSSCEDKCETYFSYTAYDPIYKTSQELRDEVGFESPQQIHSPGKIYLLGDVLFINEVGSGIHVVDNSDVRSPRPLGFINIPGNFDMAGIGNYLYADSYVDLLVFDVSDLNNIREVHRVESVFENYYQSFGFLDGRGGILVEYKERLVEEVRESDCGSGGMLETDNVNFARMDGSPMSFSANAGSNPSVAGVGGSMARFTLSGNHLYTVDHFMLRSFNIDNIAQPTFADRVEIGWGIETIFPYEDKLFLGAQNGMYIYGISNSGQASFISKYEHVTSCDPVVVKDDIAYVTLRDGAECHGFTNQLEVIDVSDVRRPQLLHVYPMQNPHGLGIDGNCLFICEGSFGLKIFDASDISDISNNLIRHFEQIHAYDVIPYNDVLMMIGQDGLYQFDYNCTSGEINLLSALPILPL